MLKRRSLAAYIIFSILTCGIYSLYFYYTVTQDLNTISDDWEPSPSLAAFLPIITCGIYSYFWIYTQGNRMEIMCKQRDIYVQENGTTYLMWKIFGFLLCGIGSLFGIHLFIKNLNQLVDDYNAKVAR